MGEHIHVPGGQCTPTAQGQKLLPALRTLLERTLCSLPLAIHLWPLSYYLLQNTLVNVGKHFYELNELLQQMSKSRENITSNLWPSWMEVVDNLGPITYD